MNKKNKVEILALLEAYRLYVDDIKANNIDNSIRVCQAIIAGVFGYNSRADWADDIHLAKLIDYGYEADTKKQYFTLTEIVKEIKI